MTLLTIPDMSCGHCKAAILKTLAEVAPQATAEINLEARTATVTGANDLPALLKALADEGY
ncbi:MAG TPA: heavy-metal-associated domain-containing protein, partial [Paracoccaceae bacterium]|nr:heavy-metal-associated domain-containing protein [Paracoccaceae bacterium]